VNEERRFVAYKRIDHHQSEHFSILNHTISLTITPDISIYSNIIAGTRFFPANLSTRTELMSPQYRLFVSLVFTDT
jgi:hypothetical protein